MGREKIKILCVDDDEDILAIAELSLALVGGHEVHICSRGREAVELAKKIEPDFILLDFMMPEMDGPATMAAIRAQEKLSNTPIAFMTARVQPHEVKEYLALGACAVVPKPFDPMTLADEVSEICSTAIANTTCQSVAS